MKKKILEILSRIKSKHLNDPILSDEKDLIVELFLRNTNEAIGIINELDEDSLEWISSRFEELSYKIQSKEFVDCVKSLLIKFPNNSILKEDVQEAIEAYFGNK